MGQKNSPNFTFPGNILYFSFFQFWLLLLFSLYGFPNLPVFFVMDFGFCLFCLFLYFFLFFCTSSTASMLNESVTKLLKQTCLKKQAQTTFSAVYACFFHLYIFCNIGSDKMHCLSIETQLYINPGSVLYIPISSSGSPQSRKSHLLPERNTEPRSVQRILGK